MASRVTEQLSVEAYLERERLSEVRHEYVDGAVLAMAGEKRVHNRLPRRFVLLLEPVANRLGCEVIVETVESLEETGEFDVPCLETTVTLEQIYADVQL